MTHTPWTPDAKRYRPEEWAAVQAKRSPEQRVIDNLAELLREAVALLFDTEAAEAERDTVAQRAGVLLDDIEARNAAWHKALDQ